ncbi:hypothetical protein ACEZCY_14630 [Streptacidiphilus sp. N1-12]|uniref:Uncharacterized protein n=2 Tax=Streptacidiphilus alkalitolerans TaxID=3342712 RepID=A0ABV6V9U4_9ACTN
MTNPPAAPPSEYHLRLATKGPGARALLLCERYPEHGMDWHAAVELAYALALAQDPTLAPDPETICAVLAPGTAAALTAADALYRPLDEAAHAITGLPPAETQARMDAYLTQARTPPGVPLPTAVHTILEGRRPDPLSDYHDARGHGLAVARDILAHQILPALGPDDRFRPIHTTRERTTMDELKTTVQVRVLLLVGGEAEVTADAADWEAPRRYPASVIAEAVGVPMAELPGMRLLADVGADDRLQGWRRP